MTMWRGMSKGGDDARKRGLAMLATEKRVRARVGPHFIADSRRARMVCHDHHPVMYAFHVDDLTEHVELASEREHAHPLYGLVHKADLRIGDRVVEEAATIFEEGPAADMGLQGFVALDWNRMDAWYEESEEVFVHPRDPNKRLDALQSHRHVVVERDGVKLAESIRPVVLIENPGLLPTRYYLPPVDVDYTHLRKSDTTTACPYKGFADYWAFDHGEGEPVDIAWRYKTTFRELPQIEGMVAFFNERVDLVVDGEAQKRPESPWSE